MNFLLISVFYVIMAFYLMEIVVIGQGIPRSPCPNIFQYRYDGAEWSGQLKVNDPPMGSKLKLKITLSLRGKPTTSFLGQIELLTRGRVTPVVYKIKFPKSEIPPKVTQIKIDDKIICYGISDYVAAFVTVIELEHTRKFSVVPKEVSTNDDGFDGSLLPKSLFHDQSNNDFTNQMCSESEQEFEINDTMNLTRDSLPWLAAIYVNNSTSLLYQCGGTLISNQIVISAAHCFETREQNFKANEILVFLGRYNLKNWNEVGSIAAPLKEIYIHPDFDKRLSSYDADIAILYLKDKIRFTEFIKPACLWSGPSELNFITGNNGFTGGWDRNNNRSKSIIPRILNTKIISNEECIKKNIKFEYLLSERSFCGLSENNKPCTGDSGMGLMVSKNNKLYLRGIIVGSVPSSNSMFLLRKLCVSSNTIYTDIGKFLDWIYAFVI